MSMSQLLLIMANPEIQIKLCDSVTLLNDALDRGLYQAVEECFAAPPFNEKITPSRVEFYFEKYVRLGTLHLAYNGDRPIAFVGTVPLIETKDLGELSLLGASVYWQGKMVTLDRAFLLEQTQNRIDRNGIEKFEYVADVGVALDYRQQGLAKRMLQTLFTYFDATTPYILRVTSDPDYAHIVELYQKVGFTVLPFTQIVEYSNSEGKLIQNERFICVKLPQTCG
ncbi:MAG: GNAT family N-acetyltransferase [Cyanobacteria bacterium P01_E01_bin.42]